MDKLSPPYHPISRSELCERLLDAIVHDEHPVLSVGDLCLEGSEFGLKREDVS